VRELASEVEVDAPAERVWHLLTDFAAYPGWNPFIRQASGELRGGPGWKSSSNRLGDAR
jgi:uncharacterized protein YndB with AHSA1/START domain